MKSKLTKTLIRIERKYDALLEEMNSENEGGMVDVALACELADSVPFLINQILELESELQFTEKELEGLDKAYEKEKQQNKRYREYFNEILTEKYGSEGLDAERELERVTDIAIKALEDESK